ncbi:MAG: DnaB-like helicase N-terminal domain-containing protein [Calditrichaceae bacterium]
MPKAKVEIDQVHIPPQDLETEKAVLGSLFLDKEAVALAVELINESYFYRTSHRLIFRAISELFEKDAEIDILTVGDTLKRQDTLDDVGGSYYLAEIANSAISSANIEQHLGIIKQ